MNNKNIPFIIACAVSLVAFLFMPFMSYSIVDVSVFDALTGDLYDLEAIAGDGIGKIGVIVTLVGGIVGVVGGVMKNKKLATWGSIAGVAGIVLYIIYVLSEDGTFEQMFEFMGSGFWIALIGFVVSIVLAGKMEE